LAWIESHQTLGRHPKTNRAAKALGIPRTQLVGHLHFLWWWVLDYASDGDLTNHEPAEIAAAADWEGDPEAFIEALASCGTGGPGFLSREDGRLAVHEWFEYAGRMLKLREGNAERKRMSRGQTCDSARDKVVTRPVTSSRGVTPLSRATQPNLTGPNLTKPEESSPPAPDFTTAEAETPKGPTPEDLLRVWNENRGPMLGAKSLSEIRRRAAKARLHQEPDLGFWTTLARNLALSPFHTGDNDRGWVADFDFFIRPKTLTQAKDGAFVPKGGARLPKLAYDPIANEARRREALGLDP